MFREDKLHVNIIKLCLPWDNLKYYLTNYIPNTQDLDTSFLNSNEENITSTKAMVDYAWHYRLLNEKVLKSYTSHSIKKYVVHGKLNSSYKALVTQTIFKFHIIFKTKNIISGKKLYTRKLKLFKVFTTLPSRKNAVGWLRDQNFTMGAFSISQTWIGNVCLAMGAFILKATNISILYGLMYSCNTLWGLITLFIHTYNIHIQCRTGNIRQTTSIILLASYLATIIYTI